ncbi:hypothetical protein [Lysobacter auxotrophicus]|uniref:DUF898 domain-containing protein n=1 Tax=Lysobacter auxotrophicus TaxID=2992573 RepID=A0ABN6UF37_9GAMM|nr:hypothetical protein [Lysobacter auxotrophicus]BDU14945.1 DUF898 domain-containing protein [Lysobacter auxotrophicus]
MTTHATGPLAGLNWLKRGINLGRHNARAVFGAAAIMMFVALLPSVLQLIVSAIVQPDANGAMAIAAGANLLSIVILSPFMGGFLRLIDATEHARPASASDIFQPLRHGGDAGRLIGFGLLMTLYYVIIGVALITVFGDGLLEWMTKVMTLQQAAGDTPIDRSQLPAAPEGLGSLLGLGSILFLFLSGVYAIGFGQVALGGRPVRLAMADGVVGTAKNLLPILLLAILVVLASIPIGLVLLVVLSIVAVVGGAIHPVVAAALVLPLYLALMVVMYVVMFGVMYYLWRDVCGPADTQGNGPPPPASSNHHQIEL